MGDLLALASAELRAQPSVDDNDDKDLPEIDADDHKLRRVTAVAWAALSEANAPPRFFSVAGILSRLEKGGMFGPALRDLDALRLRHELAQVANWVRYEKEKKRPAIPPMHVAHDVLASPQYPVPALTRVVGAPFGDSMSETYRQRPSFRAL